MELFIQEAFPCVVTHKSALDKRILARITSDIVCGQGFAHAADALLEAHKREYLRRSAQYYSVVNMHR